MKKGVIYYLLFSLLFKGYFWIVWFTIPERGSVADAGKSAIFDQKLSSHFFGLPPFVLMTLYMLIAFLAIFFYYWKILVEKKRSPLIYSGIVIEHLSLFVFML